MIVEVNSMATGRGRSTPERPQRPPATTPEGRENQLIAMAMDEAERQIREGKATSQLLTHFLKLGSTREDLEKQRLAQENKLLEAKVEQIASEKRVEDLYAKAIVAMRAYSGHPVEDDEQDQILHGTKKNTRLQRALRVPELEVASRSRDVRL
jgi:hypothetical protein